MRNLLTPSFDPFRFQNGHVPQTATSGAFVVPFVDTKTAVTYRLQVIATVGGGWDHVSVTLKNRCARWEEMEFIKRMFFEDNETAMQLHVPPAEHVNRNEFCLHLWRPVNGPKIPRPPAEFV